MQLHCVSCWTIYIYSVQNLSYIALSWVVNLLYCHCLAITGVRELRSVQMACYMYQIFMTTIGSVSVGQVMCTHMYMYSYDIICLCVRIKYNGCIRLIKNSVEVFFKINYADVKTVWWLLSVWHWEWLHILWVNDFHMLVINCLSYTYIYIYICVCVCGAVKRN